MIYCYFTARSRNATRCISYSNHVRPSVIFFVKTNERLMMPSSQLGSVAQCIYFWRYKPNQHIRKGSPLT